MDIIIDRQKFSAVTLILKKNGYQHQGDLGIVDREAFKPILTKWNDELPSHHLYVCPHDSTELKRHLNFRNFLRSQSNWRDRYGQLKLTLAKKYPTDIDQYMAEKHSLIQEILQLASL